MIRLGLISGLLCVFLLASDERRSSDVELFLFKVGFEALLEDMKDVKDKTTNNAKEIQSLNAKVNYLYQATQNKSNDDLVQDNSSSSEVTELKAVMQELQARIAELEAEEKIQEKVLEKSEEIKPEPLIASKKEEPTPQAIIRVDNQVIEYGGTQNKNVVKIKEPIVKKEPAVKKVSSRPKPSIEKLLPPKVLLSSKSSAPKRFKKVKQSNAIVKHKVVHARIWPSVNSRIVQSFNPGSAILIDSCDEFGWCKIKNKNLYVAKFLLKF